MSENINTSVTPEALDPKAQVMGTISHPEHTILLEAPDSAEAQQVLDKLGAAGKLGEFAVLRGDDGTGHETSTAIVSVQDGTVVNESGSKRWKLGTPAEEKQRLAEQSTRQMQAHEDGRDPFAFSPNLRGKGTPGSR
jgi:hypothetical protein